MKNCSEYFINFFSTDRESSAQSNCPSLFLHNFTYSHDNGTIASCKPANGSADGCFNRSQVAFDFTKCSAPFGFSSMCSNDVNLWVFFTITQNMLNYYLSWSRITRWALFTRKNKCYTQSKAVIRSLILILNQSP